MPYFCKDPESRAFERLMQRVPNFETDPPEADVIQRSLKHPHRSKKKEERDPMIFRGSDHQRLFVQEMKRHPDATDQFTAALYLLTADNELWRQTQDRVSTRDIDLTGLKVHGLTEQSYVFYCAAKDMLNGSNIVNVQDIADRTVIPAKAFMVLFAAITIRGYGMGTAQRMKLAV